MGVELSMSIMEKQKCRMIDDKLLQKIKQRSVTDTVTIEMTNSNNINFPFEWLIDLDIGHGYVQITLVDDRIVIHKPTAPNVVYTAPCKVGDNSYIRSLGLFSVRIPKQLLSQLGIKDGDKVDLALEENCISISKHMSEDSAGGESISEAHDPLMAFCCVCAHFLYTENALVKVASKYICHECTELVKSID